MVLDDRYLEVGFQYRWVLVIQHQKHLKLCGTSEESFLAALREVWRSDAAEASTAERGIHAWGHSSLAEAFDCPKARVQRALRSQELSEHQRRSVKHV